MMVGACTKILVPMIFKDDILLAKNITLSKTNKLSFKIIKHIPKGIVSVEYSLRDFTDKL